MTSEKLTAIVGISAAALGFVGGLVGAQVGAHATIVTQREQLASARNERARSVRTATYTRFIRATTAFGDASITITQECPVSEQTSRVAESSCPKQLVEDFVKAQGRFQRAINDVYTYGTQQGVAAAVRLAQPLPSPARPFNGQIINPPVYDAPYDAAFKRMLTVMCREVSPDPRPDC